MVTRKQTGKIRRLGGNSNVRIALCTINGGIRGEWLPGTAEILRGGRAEEAVRLRDKKYGILARIAKIATARKGDLIAIAIRLG